jgi:hypothetical protein
MDELKLLWLFLRNTLLPCYLASQQSPIGWPHFLRDYWRRLVLLGGDSLPFIFCFFLL